MNLYQSLHAVLIRKYATFSGRAGRSEYWWFTLFATVLLVGVAVPLAVLAPMDSISTVTAAAILSLVQIALLLALGLPTMAVTARRFHDIGISGWWQLINFIPVVGTIAVLVLAAQAGESGPNRYGVGRSSSQSRPRPVSVGELFLRKATNVLAVWGVLSAVCVVAAMVVLGLQSEDLWNGWSSAALAGWIAAASGLWPDMDMAAGWLAPVAGLLLGLSGAIVLRRYRRTDPPRVMSLLALLAGLISLAASVALAMTYGGMGFADTMQYALFPLGFLADGYAPGEAVNVLWQIGASMTMAWILVFAIRAFRPERAAAGFAESAIEADFSFR